VSARRKPVSDQELKDISRLKFRKMKLPPVSMEQWQERMTDVDVLSRAALHITTLSKSKIVAFIADLELEQRRETLEGLHRLAKEDLPALQEIATAAEARFLIAFAAYAERAGKPGR
jgi:hypothetical protein